MAAALERSYERTVRVKAPLRGLYREMDTVDGLIRFIPQIERHRAAPDGESAVAFGSMSLGPLSWQLRGDIRIEQVDPPNALNLFIDVPSVQMTFRGVFEFSTSAADETTLRFAATVSSSHNLVRRMRSSLTGALEDFVDSTTDRVAILARQYAEAERRFSDIQQQRGND